MPGCVARRLGERARRGRGGCGWAKPGGVPALPASPRDNVGNYRPVRLTSALGNIMEELIQDLINKKLKEVI